ncbi:MAG: hypothetical protein ABIH82_04500 [Candidatus Woesearchaeota archaeon]
MSLKQILGLDACLLSEIEIMEKIAEAQKKDIRVIEFPIGKKTVQITLKGINPKGIMKDYEQREEDT